MKRITLILLGLLMSAEFILAGGLVTNTNQSTAWTRMLVRDATTEIDGVFFNPAGLVKLQNGFHISISNQSIFQTQTITSNYPFLNPNPKEYVGDISAPLFPSLYLAYKTGRWVFSLGVNVVGGGGGAKFSSGVPMMEIPIAGLVPALEPLGVSGYNVDMSFEGRSAYWGIQAGASFEITKNISVFAGARYVIAKNTYSGYMNDITVTTPQGDLPPGPYVQGVSDQASAGAAQANGAAEQMDPLVAGFGDKTLVELTGMGILTEEQAAQMAGGLIQLGVPEEQVLQMNMTQMQGGYYAAGTELTATSAYLAGQAAYLSVVTADQDADVTQTGNGITPILGANLSFMDNDLNIGIKYEFKTKMDLTNSTPDGKGFVTGIDPNTGKPIEMFPNDSVTNADMPAFLSVGIEYRIIDPLLITVGYHTYFDKGTTWAQDAEDDGTPTIDNNFFEIGLGLQWDINESFLVSAGFLHANTGVSQEYQSDLNFSLNSNTIGLGGAWKINDTFKLQLGGYYVMYDKGTYDYTEENTGIAYQNSYLKSTWAISLGLDIAIGGKKK